MNFFGEVGTAGYAHIFLFCILLPIVAVRSAKKLELMPYPPRLRFYFSVVPQHIFFIAISVAVAYYEFIPLHFASLDIKKSIWLSALLLLAMVPVMSTRWRKSVIDREKKAFLFMPHGKKEKVLWLVISTLAGIGEEITYRGVMWILLSRLTGSYWGAALIASAVFALSHYMQGWKSIGAIMLFALVFHVLVWYTGSLIEAIVVHTVYDMIAGLAYGYLGRKYDYPMEGTG